MAKYFSLILLALLAVAADGMLDADPWDFSHRGFFDWLILGAAILICVAILWAENPPKA